MKISQIRITLAGGAILILGVAGSPPLGQQPADVPLQETWFDHTVAAATRGHPVPASQEIRTAPVR